MRKPHIVAIPYPAQGHVIPTMELCLCLVKHGCKVTFVNTEFNHKRIMESMSEADNVINLVTFPDGLEVEEDRNDPKKLAQAIIFEVVPEKVEALIRKINESDENRVSCVIADENLGWALDLGKRLGLQRVAFWTASAASLAMMLNVPKLVDDGIVGNNGEILRKQSIKLLPLMPAMNSTDLLWNCFSDPGLQKLVFDLAFKNNESLKAAEWVICNSSQVMEYEVFASYPKLIPIGPLLASNRLGETSGHFWREDTDCLKWLDQQPLNSVIYVAFGSHTIFNMAEFQELALGLELTNRPFLWVVRQGFIEETGNPYPEGFIDRTRNRGWLVEWAPQQKVLAHPSLGCFLSHCGWNSTIEGVSNGLPFLCWPYFADQLFNKSYICDVWKVGLGFDRNENGVIGRQEIKTKVEQLFGDENFKARAVDLQVEVVSSVKSGGSSYQNFSSFVNWIKAKN
ncbi:PREDICTED: UDP-glycosyltransferase 83A1-like [Ipomoea nil]|uniref:UDP-glycosyltransferase 83A1-like n=1 Tax=Ipomoea nil TaxID=35883 RepID=UPI000901549F|nr:PREDICTED: UDP-glycosyltransferase 83A1-like [Ipomoea nil]